MGQRIEAGPLVAIAGASLLLVSLFLEWYAPGLSAWTVFEALDLVLAGLALAAIWSAAGLLVPDLSLVDRRLLVPLAAIATVVVASQLLNPPPATADLDPRSGAWLALAGALLMAAGAILSFGRLRLAVTVEERDPRRRVAAVDGRASARPAAASAPDPGAVPASERFSPSGQ